MKKAYLQFMACLFLLGVMIFLKDDLKFIHYLLVGSGLLYFGVSSFNSFRNLG